MSMPTATLLGDSTDTFVPVRIHQMTWREQGEYQDPIVIYGSFVGPGSALKILRGGCALGLRMLIAGNTCTMPANVAGTNYRFSHAKLAEGLFHATVRATQDDHVLLLDNNSDEEWRDELMRVSTLPIQPEWIGRIVAAVKQKHKPAKLENFGCSAVAYHLNEEHLSKILVGLIKGGDIVIPECESDMETVTSVSDYIRMYADKMVASAGVSMKPLFDPRAEEAAIPPLMRSPFTPQAWLIEAGKRQLANNK